MAIDDELGLGPALHNLWRRICELFGRSGSGRAERPLDPMVVDHEAWRAMRSGARTWPDYKEAPNRFAVRVSQADWDEYWGIDPDRKAESVTRYLLRQAADRDLWVAGEPKVSFSASDEISRGGVAVSASFAENGGAAGSGESSEADEAVLKPAKDYLRDSPGDAPEPSGAERDARVVEPGAHVPADETVVVRRARPSAEQDPWQMPSRPEGGSRRRRSRGRLREEQVPDDVREQLTGANPDETIVLDRPNTTLDDTQAVPRPVRPEMAAQKPASKVAYLLGEGGFRMLVHPGDVIGAVQGELEMPGDVNVRLDGRGFPGVEPKQLRLDLGDAGWTLTDYPESGTTVDRIAGGTETVRAEETVGLNDGDVIYLGPTRPMRFHMGE